MQENKQKVESSEVDKKAKNRDYFSAPENDIECPVVALTKSRVLEEGKTLIFEVALQEILSAKKPVFIALAPL